ncbi:enoyl-CoA hydratase-related protein [Sphingopyxis fribergensis]
MDYSTILVRQEGGARIITLNRPERLNAHIPQLGQDLKNAVRAADDDDSVRAIIITGAGRAFCAGQDLDGGADVFRREGAPTGEEFATGDHEFLAAFLDSKKVIIGAINGPAVGAGSTMLLPMDFRIASTNARFGFVFVKLGIVPESGAAWFLPRLVGDSWTRRWCLTGRLFGADEALAAGLVDQVVAPDRLMAEALALAEEIAANTSPVAVAVARQMLWRCPAMDNPRDLFALELELFADLSQGPDIGEGIAAFLEKRPPRFTSSPATGMPSSYPWWTQTKRS